MGPPGQPWAGLSGFWGFPPFLALVETVAVAVHLQDMNVVCEPVQQRPSQAPTWRARRAAAIVPPPASGPTFARFAAEYVERGSPSWKPLTHKATMSYLHSAILPVLGALRVDAVTPPTWRASFTGMGVCVRARLTGRTTSCKLTRYFRVTVASALATSAPRGPVRSTPVAVQDAMQTDRVTASVML